MSIKTSEPTLRQNNTAKESFKGHYAILYVIEAMCDYHLKSSTLLKDEEIKGISIRLTGLAFGLITEEDLTDWLLEMFLRLKPINIHTGSSLDSLFKKDELEESLKCMEIIKKFNKKSKIFKKG